MTINFGFCNVIVLVMMFIHILYVAVHNGEPQDDYDIGETMIGTIIMLLLLYFGGFFS